MYWYLKCWKQYADFSGRARRKEYWMFVLFNFIAAMAFGIVDGVLGLANEVIGLGVLGGLYSLAAFIPSLAVSVRRLHDIGKSGWYYLLGLIPLLGAIVLLVWFCTEGEYGANKWGENPKLEDQ